MQIISNQEIKSTVYNIEAKNGIYYQVQINYIDGVIEGWIAQENEGKKDFLIGLYDDEPNTTEIILNEAFKYIKDKEKE